MEAATLQRKKTTISKGKLKKTIKNVLCRPDPLPWPVVSEEHEKAIRLALDKHKVHIQEFKKPHWKELKDIPKEKRPKPPKIIKLDGLIFGLMESCDVVKSKKCSAIILDSAINPHTIAQPILESCRANGVPALCLNDLRKICLVNFGISTSCLAIKKDSLQDLASQIIEIANSYKDSHIPVRNVEPIKMEIDKEENKKSSNITHNLPVNLYLHRTDKKTRVFTPSSGQRSGDKKVFAGQNFITVSETNEKPDRKTYMNMIMKRITSNQGRAKRK